MTMDWVKETMKDLKPPSGNRKGYWVMGPGYVPPHHQVTAYVPI